MAMLRSTATRSLLRSLAAKPTSSAPIRQQFRSQLCTLSARTQAAKPLAPKTLALTRWASTTAKGDQKPMDAINERTESELGKQKLEAHPELVSSTSSTHAIHSELGAAAGERGHNEDDTDMMGGVKGEMKTIRETFSLESVPREAYYVGMAGVLPYMATSLATFYCAWDMNYAAETGSGFLLSGKTAELALHVIEPLQVGYGAVIISFLGAIHWGLEFAGYGGYHGYRRYFIGVFSTALAWPTLLLPVEYALISQFLVFNYLYYSDARACKRGWTPQWYGVYRFVLTFIVGSAIVLSLVGRGQIAHLMGETGGPTAKIKQLREAQVEQLEEEEDARRKFLASSDEDEDEEEGGDEDEE
ncbi:hypothetical protein LTR36_005995 [Oleoguttula mirabilis]|uniref:Mitochondrial inner membrane protein 1 n=1 Tax=Oleoguttula mirabilis TaxID=1507867 RepID=A0AAV9JEU6_9PEZI|nr:hypothetical protein LTR36_005995 [Oleoguttula mirabilis]